MPKKPHLDQTAARTLRQQVTELSPGDRITLNNDDRYQMQFPPREFPEAIVRVRPTNQQDNLCLRPITTQAEFDQLYGKANHVPKVMVFGITAFQAWKKEIAHILRNCYAVDHSVVVHVTYRSQPCFSIDCP